MNAKRSAPDAMQLSVPIVYLPHAISAKKSTVTTAWKDVVETNTVVVFVAGRVRSHVINVVRMVVDLA